MGPFPMVWTNTISEIQATTEILDRSSSTDVITQILRVHPFRRGHNRTIVLRVARQEPLRMVWTNAISEVQACFNTGHSAPLPDRPHRRVLINRRVALPKWDEKSPNEMTQPARRGYLHRDEHQRYEELAGSPLPDRLQSNDHITTCYTRTCPAGARK